MFLILPFSIVANFFETKNILGILGGLIIVRVLLHEKAQKKIMDMKNFLKKKFKKNLQIYLEIAFILSLLLSVLIFFDFFDNLKNFEVYPLIVMGISGLSLIYINREVFQEKKELKKTHKYISILLILTAIVFLTTKVLMPIHFTGGYIGEYYNTMAGMHLFQSGELPVFYDHGSQYTRGMLTSFFVGLYTAVFGQSIFVAKMVPATAGILSFFLLFLISKRIFKHNIVLISMLLIYTFSPFILFNHFFIRFYSFYEVFLFLKIFLVLKIYDSIKQKKEKSFSIFLSLLILAEVVTYYGINDTGKYLSLVVTAVLLSYIFLTTENVFKKKFLNILNLEKKFKLLILTITGTVFFFLLDGFRKIDYLLNVEPGHPADTDLGFPYLFFEVHLIYTVFFLISAFSLILFSKKHIEKIVALVGLTIFFLFLISSPDMQLIRVMMFFLGFFFLTSFLFLDKVKTFSKTLFYISVIALLGLLPFTYPEDFLKHPYLPGESGYTEFSEAFDFLKNEKPNSTNISIISGIPSLPHFHGVEMSYFLNYERAERWWMDLDEEKIILGDIPIVYDIEEIKEENLCVIIREPSSDYYINQKTRDFLRKSWAEERKRFRNITIFCNH